MSARALAIKVLARVEATDAYLNVVLDSLLSEERPADARDTSLVTELCYGATRRRMTLDYALEAYVDRKLEQLEDRVLAALRIGAYQLLYLRIPPRAAVAETVEALKSLGLSRATGFANAILRRIAELPGPLLPPESEPMERLAVETSHPRWLVERWTRQLGPARAKAVLEANNTAARVVVRANTARIERDALLAQLREAGIDSTPTPVSPVGIVLPSLGALEQLYGYREGLWQVQDEAAQLVVCFADLPEDARVLDVCAAPGGKALQSAQHHLVVACDLHANKLRKIEAEAQRLGLTERLKTRAHDATQPFPEALGEFDAVIVDAPCSGLGTLRRHPELRYRRAEKDLAELTALQRKILQQAQARVAPGGLLIYAVCSLDPEEGQDQVDMFLRSHPEFTSEPPTSRVTAAFPQVQGYLRTLPGPEAWDGFFAARLRRQY
jgi:16S rRNA (cytosine967-C5)-methyltransferase